jgi:hypothetical protein
MRRQHNLILPLSPEDALSFIEIKDSILMHNGIGLLPRLEKLREENGEDSGTDPTNVASNELKSGLVG